MDTINNSALGLNTDSVSTQLPSGSLTYALNALVESFSGDYIAYQNEQSNIKCFGFPSGYYAVGVKSIPQINRALFFLTNPTTGNSQIGYTEGDCTYTILIDDKDTDCKLGFDINYPIRKVIPKSTNCSTQVYWTDGLNPRRYIDFDDLPWKEIRASNSPKLIKQVGQLDCNKLLVQPNFSIPEIDLIEVEVGGELVMGSYQFAVQYSNALGEGYTSFYNVTNPLGIFENKFSPDFNLPTSKAITVKVEHLDTSGLYEHFNLAVIKTINLITTVELVATLPIKSSSYTYTYTGSDKTPIPLTIEDIFEKFPYYDIAEDIFEVDNILGWAKLRSQENINYQKIWAKVNLDWETYQIPYNSFQGYSNGLNTALYRGYMRDEVYPFEGCFLLKNGKQTDSFHIPGRVYNNFDRDIIGTDNKDNTGIINNACENPSAKYRWQVYNTASITGFSPEFLTKSVSDDCYVGPYQYGEFGYWESEDTYPNNVDIFGDLAGQQIRHHKFPDSSLVAIFDNVDPNLTADEYKSFEHHIYPIGVKVDIASLYDAINNSDLSPEEKESIVGFKITRGNRAANKSIIAKGILHNVGFSSPLEEDNETPIGSGFYYPNYPYNDLRRDPYFASTKLVPNERFNYSRSIDGFNAGEDNKQRFIFHSPDTHFYQPSLDNQGEYLNLYNIYYGKSYSHFDRVKDNAEYKFLTPNTIYAAAAIAIAGGFTIGAGTFGSPTFSAGNVASTYQGATELFDKLVPYTNFGYSFNSVGFYGNSYPIPNSGNKIRAVEYNKYLIAGMQTIEEGKLINNIGRESSVYVKVNDNVLFPNEYDTSIPADISRYNLASQYFDVAPDPSTKVGYVLLLGPQPFAPILIGDTYKVGGVEYKIVSVNITFTSSGLMQGGIVVASVLGNTPPLSSGPLIRVTGSGAPAIGYVYNGLNYYISQKSRNTTQNRNISSYYGGIKRYLPSQWGRLYSYETIDTGYYQPLLDENNNRFSIIPTVFGGDIFINRFAYKSKLPIFTDNTVKGFNQQDISYDELGTLGWPMFWLSTKPQSFNIDIADQVDKVAKELFDPSAGSIILNVISGALVGSSKIQKLFRQIFSQIYEKIGVKNINLDQAFTEGISEQGLMYLFAYGIPYFFCESEVNVDYRQAYNEREGNFFPNISSGIPDDWFQEVNVPIIYDNTYTYNQSYSKQNKENFFSHLREDYDPTKLCYTEHPNRAIWSDPSSLEETKNNWLVYRPAALFNFPKSYGTLTSIDNIEHRQLLVRFDNKSQVYNALTKVSVDNAQDAYLGNSQLFSSTPPLDLAETDIGYAGSQHQLFLKTEFGQVFVDAKRGQVILLQGNRPTDIADKGMDKWFSENLPFQILNYFPNANIDNHFNNLGLCGVYDAFYQRLILTKLDYTPKGTVYFDEATQKFYSDPNLTEHISLTDTTYFNSKCWTLSYSFKTQSWVSFHSYQPNFYIPYPTYFQTGDNNEVWDHNIDLSSFCNFYSVQYPYILEYPFVYKVADEILQSVKDYCSAVIYESPEIYYEPDETIYFNKAIVYNRQQSTGLLNLIPNQQNSLSFKLKYPKYNASSIDVILTKSDNTFNFNDLRNIVISDNRPIFSSSGDTKTADKELDNTNLSYSAKSFTQSQLRAKDTRVRLILDEDKGAKLTSKFIITESQTSYK